MKRKDERATTRKEGIGFHDDKRKEEEEEKELIVKLTKLFQDLVDIGTGRIRKNKSVVEQELLDLLTTTSNNHVHLFQTFTCRPIMLEIDSDSTFTLLAAACRANCSLNIIQALTQPLFFQPLLSSSSNNNNNISNVIWELGRQQQQNQQQQDQQHYRQQRLHHHHRRDCTQQQQSSSILLPYHSILHLACEFASIQVVQHLVHVLPNKAKWTMDKNGYLPLYYATTRGHVQMSRLVSNPTNIVLKHFCKRRECIYKVHADFPSSRVECFKAIFPRHVLEFSFALLNQQRIDFQYSYMEVTELNNNNNNVTNYNNTSNNNPNNLSLPNSTTPSSLSRLQATTEGQNDNIDNIDDDDIVVYRIRVVACWNQENFQQQLPIVLDRLRPHSLHLMRHSISQQLVQQIRPLDYLQTLNLSLVVMDNETTFCSLMNKTGCLGKMVMDQLTFATTTTLLLDNDNKRQEEMTQFPSDNVMPTRLLIINCPTLIQSKCFYKYLQTTKRLKALMVETGESTTTTTTLASSHDNTSSPLGMQSNERTKMMSNDDDALFGVLNAMRDNTSIGALIFTYSPSRLQHLLHIVQNGYNRTLRVVHSHAMLQQQQQDEDENENYCTTLLDRHLGLYLAWNALNRRQISTSYSNHVLVKALEKVMFGLPQYEPLVSKDTWFTSEDAVTSLLYMMLREHPGQWSRSSNGTL